MYFHTAITAFKGQSLTVIVVADTGHCFKDADGTSSLIWLKQKKKKLSKGKFAIRIIPSVLDWLMKITLYLNPKSNEKPN